MEVEVEAEAETLAVAVVETTTRKKKADLMMKKQAMRMMEVKETGEVGLKTRRPSPEHPAVKNAKCLMY